MRRSCARRCAPVVAGRTTIPFGATAPSAAAAAGSTPPYPASPGGTVAGEAPARSPHIPLNWLVNSAEERRPGGVASPCVAEISHPTRPRSRRKTSLVSPETLGLLAQDEFLDLAGGGLGQRPEHDRARHLEVRHVGAAEG